LYVYGIIQALLGNGFHGIERKQCHAETQKGGSDKNQASGFIAPNIFPR